MRGNEVGMTDEEARAIVAARFFVNSLAMLIFPEAITSSSVRITNSTDGTGRSGGFFYGSKGFIFSDFWINGQDRE